MTIESQTINRPQIQSEIILAGKVAAKKIETFNTSLGSQDAQARVCDPVLQNNDQYSLDWLLSFK